MEFIWRKQNDVIRYRSQIDKREKEERKNMENLSKSPREYLKRWNEMTNEEIKEVTESGAMETPDKYFLLWLVKKLGHVPSKEEYEKFYNMCSKEEQERYLPPRYYEGMESILF